MFNIFHLYGGIPQPSKVLHLLQCATLLALILGWADRDPTRGYGVTVEIHVTEQTVQEGVVVTHE